MTSFTIEHDQNGTILLCMYVRCIAETSTALRQVKSNEVKGDLLVSS